MTLIDQDEGEPLKRLSVDLSTMPLLPAQLTSTTLKDKPPGMLLAGSNFMRIVKEPTATNIA